MTLLLCRMLEKSAHQARLKKSLLKIEKFSVY